MDNDIILVKTESQDAEYLEKVRELYHAAFPEEERRDWSDFVELLRDEPAFNLFSIFDGSRRWLGFITLWNLGPVTYGEHFAVTPEGRGGGIGARVINRVPEPCVLEVELPVGEMERRRIGFYERNGFTLHPEFKYLQPPYREGGEHFPLLLMTKGVVDLDVATKLIHSKVYGYSE